MRCEWTWPGADALWWGKATQSLTFRNFLLEYSVRVMVTPVSADTLADDTVSFVEVQSNTQS